MIPHNYKTFIIVTVLIDIVIVAIVCCFVKCSLTKIKLLNKNFQHIDVRFLCRSSGLVYSCLDKLNDYEVYAVPFVAEIPVSNVRVVCLCI